jgi:hypothetical protein
MEGGGGKAWYEVQARQHRETAVRGLDRASAKPMTPVPSFNNQVVVTVGLDSILHARLGSRPQRKSRPAWLRHEAILGDVTVHVCVRRAALAKKYP